jgi:hypothetical protein
VNPAVRSAPVAAACALLFVSLLALGDDDADSNQPAAEPGLTSEQQHAVGIVVAHPLTARAPERIEALGLVLDATALVADLGDATASAAA